MKLRYATLCSGIEAVSLGWEPLGAFRPVFFSEIEAFPNAVLAHHWPGVPNLGDLTQIDGSQWRGKVDVLWASFPCQDYSLAGKRAGAAGARGGLALAGIDLVDTIDPHFFCFENVKGLLSDRQNAFGHLLGRLVGHDRALEPPNGRWTHSGDVSGPKRSAAWRLLDAQHSGVAQQRNRVFLVACPRGGASPQSILFEREGVRRDAPPDRQATPEAAASAIGRARFGFRSVPAFGEIARCLTAASTRRLDADTEDFIVESAEDRPLRIRTLTPLERERLMGFPDNHTRIPWKGKPDLSCPDGPRYKAIGNSLAVPDVRWIGERIVAHVNEALGRKGRTRLAA